MASNDVWEVKPVGCGKSYNVILMLIDIHLGSHVESLIKDMWEVSYTNHLTLFLHATCALLHCILTEQARSSIT